jgi:formate hydrogenlyase subunit 3/multisubunit Na+/H+ antiporter MnhD subunit
MVDPIYIFIIILAAAFLLTLFQQFLKKITLPVFYLVLGAVNYITIYWFFHVIRGYEGAYIFTAGFFPPFSINLILGIEESFFLIMINFLLLLSAIYLYKKFAALSVKPMILYLILMLGLNGLIMTRDLFNLFVFLEITSIATYSLIAIEDNRRSLSAGFKFIIAGGLVSTLFLIGTIYLYRLGGSLNIDFLVNSGVLDSRAGILATFLLVFAVLIELKPFPANGWALDVYQSVNSGITAIIASASSAAIFFVIYKFIPLMPATFLPLLAGIGITTFIISNLMGLKQTDARRLLGYSSIAQMGLLLTALALIMQFKNVESITSLVIIIGGLFINHFIAKAGLFWLAGVVKKRNIKSWNVIANYPPLVIVFGGFILALVGLPPFPGFWAKWELIMQLSANKMMLWVWLILIGSLIEAVYLFRWFGLAVKNKEAEEIQADGSKFIPIFIFLLGLVYIGLEGTRFVSGANYVYIVPVLIGTILYVLNWLPVKVKGFLTLATVGYYAYQLILDTSGIYQIFSYIFLAGSAVLIFSTLSRKESGKGFYPILLILILSMGNLLRAETSLQFFLSWEFITLSTYLLIIKGKFSFKAGLLYIIFSLAGAYLILIGFATAYGETGTIILAALASIINSTPIFVLLTLGFLIKTGAIGLHIWLPDAYAESEDEFSAFLSSILSKVGIFGLFLIAILLGEQVFKGINLYYLLSWIGVATAFFGALFATFQEDIKKLIAYSSMGQIGYIVLAFAIYSHLGWVTALYITINHLLFKGIIFVGVAGIISRVKTRKMYEMGGLINNMPLTFISILIAIIALSGVPPLTGFGGKWLLYSSLIEKGWYYQAGLAFFASSVAFLYCYRILHSVFLGQPKPVFKELKEPSIWYIIPQYIFLIGIMAFSMYPNLILKPIMSAISIYFPSTVNWEGYTVISSLGYWNGNAVMMVTMGVFMVPTIWLLLRLRAITKVKQFNIVFSAERPDRPETSHYAHNFFAHYQKALGFLAKSKVTTFWNGIAEGAHSIGSMFRHIYSGNGQTYAIHILIFIVVSYLLLGVK